METLIFRRGEEIDKREAGLGILQKYWKAFAPRDVYEWRHRIENSGGYIVAAYVNNVIAGVLEGMRLDTGGNPDNIPATFKELTADGTWSNHNESGDTVMLVDLTIAPNFHGAGRVEAFAQFARKTFESPTGLIMTYSPLFLPQHRYLVLNKHVQLGARLAREFTGSRPGLTMRVAGEELMAEDVGIAAYTV